MKALICFLLASLLMLPGALAENEITFQMDQVFASDTEGTIHYNLYVPESYDGTVPYALYMALPGWDGLFAREPEIMNWLFSQQKGEKITP